MRQDRSNKKYTMEELHEIARARDGKCLSEKYINNVTMMKWECREGHFFEKSLTKIISRQSWCSVCNINVSEEICRVIFEQIFQQKFIKCTPAYLQSSFGGVMEIDGYCEKLNIAFEYQGIQHYQ